jgi:hypothetical protein
VQQNNSTKRLNLLLIIGFVLFAVIIGAVIYLINRSAAPKNITEQQNITTDKTSGEELVDTVGKDEETVGKNPNAPLLVGFSQLLDLGVTDDDTKAMKQFVTDYILATPSIAPKSKLSFDRSSFVQKINDDFTTDYQFTVVLNDKTKYTIRAHTDSISSLTLSMTDTKGAVVFSK